MEKKVALVTGSYRGLGLETARQLAELGYTVIITARTLEKAQKGASQLKSFSDQIHAYELDITQDQSVENIYNWVTDTFGRLDVLINNAAINYDTWNSALDADLNEIGQTIDANLMGAWRMVQALVPLMKKGGFGRIVNVSSGAGAINGMGGGTPGYSVSKAALNVLTIKLAAEVSGHGILVNSVCPGWVRTDMGGSAAPRSVQEGAQGIVWAATLDTNGPNGGFFRDGEEIKW